ncbi:hypothetical protein HCN44_002334 [Aphidius gifuensis]|uniref:Uncharacterized protein n=1 Tax=Aphidius gifuensis TaxID=684658 RepID=A0A834XZZ5_APHGI|nr:probable multidrug resistance-associated protein lethal(2)03659 [Aphidius gifuensis]KAF7996688.1 hypothetical protein HCN44_002334 [Aphidius gifuensis]
MNCQFEIVKKKNPREGANCLSVLTYTWVLKTFLTGFKRDLTIDDLPRVLDEHKSNFLGDKITKAWNNELEYLKNKKPGKYNNLSSPNLLRVICKVFGWKIAAYGIIFAVFIIPTRTLQPLMLAKFIEYFSMEKTKVKVTKKEAYIYATGVVICTTVNIFVVRYFIMIMSHMGMKIRIACSSLIYRKVLKLSQKALKSGTAGQAINILSNDVTKFDTSMVCLHYLWISPLLTILATWFMYCQVGNAAIIGVLFLLMFIPIIGWIGKKTSIYRRDTAVKSDERVRLVNEIINGIQAIKIYSWEYPFSYLIENTRKAEVRAIQSTLYLRCIVSSFVMFISRISLFITILAMIYLTNYNEMENNKITSAHVFMLVAYYDLIRVAMTDLYPKAVLMCAEAVVSFNRIQEFLMYDEIVNQSLEKPKIFEIYRPIKIDKQHENNNSHEGKIIIERLCARWIKEDTLSGINMQVNPGQLVAIVGPVGSGKSSLLNVILKELAVYQGSVDVQGNIAYACQEPWLFAGSVRNNILFGRALDQKRYERVVKVCQLKRDYQLFPYGDKTIVGDRGVSLSGGQRARINLARAVYADAPIYLFDDPLSAVDAHVGKHMFEECIEKYLKGKTRILVTHQIQFLQNVDKIIVMKEGKIEAKGSYDELTSRGIDIGRLSVAPANEDEDKTSLYGSSNSHATSRQTSICSISSILTNKIINNELEPVNVEEKQSRGNIGSKIYATYFSMAENNCLVFFTLVMSIAAQLFGSGSDYFISFWIKLEEQYTNLTTADSERILSRTSCVIIFSIIITGTIIITLLRSFIFVILSMKSSKRLHDKIFKSISRATMKFFNTNPSGRILNRFSKDLGTVDDLLPITMLDCIQNGFSVIGIVIVVALTNFWLIIAAFFIGIIFYYMRILYLATSRSVKRLEGITKSPVFNHLNATCQGLATIRSSNAQQVLTDEFDSHQDLHSSAWYIFIASSTAFGFWSDIFCLLYLILVALNFLVFADSSGDSSTDANVGLALTQIIGLTGTLQFAMRQSAELENQMTSVERVCEYTNLESEPPLESLPDKKPKEEWPESGNIKFKNVYMSYDPEEAPVLKNLNFTIAGKEKVGIVGRTGAGKSSLISALFRLAYIDGKIEIDGIETGAIGLHDLRSKISIIPQEPFLFAGTLRRNLDPFDLYKDHLLWSALEDVELKEMGLQAHVNEGGSNLSVGQRQLVCLARAIIRNNRVLILDEATANVDPRTDELIQKTIRRKFADCTVLTIAHRLNTVMDSDKILVMDAGTVVEFDHPHVLLQNPDGALSSMINETSKADAHVLSLLAKKNYHRHDQQSKTSL